MKYSRGHINTYNDSEATNNEQTCMTHDFVAFFFCSLSIAMRCLRSSLRRAISAAFSSFVIEAAGELASTCAGGALSGVRERAIDTGRGLGVAEKETSQDRHIVNSKIVLAYPVTVDSQCES